MDSNLFKVLSVLTGLQRPDKGVSLGDQSPAGTEAEQTNALVTRAGTEEVADEG